MNPVAFPNFAYESSRSIRPRSHISTPMGILSTSNTSKPSDLAVGIKTSAYSVARTGQSDSTPGCGGNCGGCRFETALSNVTAAN